jgi:hypothetical protein
MGNPCGGDEFRKWNDFVELYNYGDQPQDVGGWWLTVNGPGNKSDKLVAWATRNPNVALNQPVVTNTTRIPAHGFIVAAQTHQGRLCQENQAATDTSRRRGHRVEADSR